MSTNSSSESQRRPSLNETFTVSRAASKTPPPRRPFCSRSLTPEDLAPVVQRAETFIHWIGRYAADKMCAKIDPYNPIIWYKVEALRGKLAKSFGSSSFYPLDNNLSTG